MNGYDGNAPELGRRYETDDMYEGGGSITADLCIDCINKAPESWNHMEAEFCPPITAWDDYECDMCGTAPIVFHREYLKIT